MNHAVFLFLRWLTRAESREPCLPGDGEGARPAAQPTGALLSACCGRVTYEGHSLGGGGTSAPSEGSPGVQNFRAKSEGSR